MYIHIGSMINSPSLRARIMGCAALEGHPDPERFTSINMMKIVADSDWANKWQTAADKYDTKFNPDTGARSDVITDNMILAAVQPLVQADLDAQEQVNNETP